MPDSQVANQGLQGMSFGRSFAGHETFAFRHTWLKKGTDQILKDPEVFIRDDAIVRLGVGKNMVRSIRYWCTATRVAEEEPGTRGRRMRCTELGIKLLSNGGWDPFLEDDATLWLLHWNLASGGTQAATWYMAFNQFHEYAFTRRAMVEFIMRRLEAIAWSGFAASTIERDVDCFVHTYLPRASGDRNNEDELACPLSTLGLLVQEPDGVRLRFQRGPKPTLPSPIFACALIEFWKHQCGNRLAMEVREIVGSAGSPAMVFKLDEESVLSYLDALSDITAGALIFEDTVQVRRVVKNADVDISPEDLLEAYYGRV